MKSSPEIFFSYAWNDENESNGGREKLVDQLYTSLIKDNYNVVRDKYDVKYKDFLSAFINKLGKGKCIVVAISEKYLKSSYCMFELYEIARHSHFDKALFREKILPILVESVDFNDPQIIKQYILYWDGQYKLWSDLLTTHAGQLSVEQMQRYDRIRMIHQNFGKLVDWLADINSLDPKILSEDNFAEIKKAISAYGTNSITNVHEPTFWRRLISTLGFWLATIAAVLLAIFWLWKSENPKIEEGPKLVSVIISGLVKDSITKQALQGAEIFLSNHQDKLIKSGSTDSLGQFDLETDFINDSSERKITIRIAKNGYHDNKQVRTFSGDGKYFIPDIVLQKLVSTRSKSVDTGKAINKGTNKETLNHTPINKPGVEKEAPAIILCKAICETKGIIGVEVSFRDPKNNKKYIGMSNGRDLEFDVPCYLTESDESVQVTFIRNDTSDYVNVRLKRFEIPLMFK